MTLADRISTTASLFSTTCRGTPVSSWAVANNTYDEREFLGKRDGGRLAEWDGKSAKWTIVERNPFVEVHASGGDGSYGGNTLYAVGWTKSSVSISKNE